MLSRPTLWVLALVIVVSNATEDTHDKTTTVQRLVGGYLSSDNPERNSGLTAASTGAGRESRQQKLEDEEKKTLSQQVADGKYGLIQKELFSTPVKKPGVISYERNSEVPKDNIKNLGGLQKNEIWLAENHLLVLKGGSFSANEDRTEHSPPLWPPIDDYSAPQRQVKIPSNPKVPPPFPVQLTEGGPLQLLGTNYSTTLNGSIDASAFALPPPEGYVPGTGPFFPPLYPYPANSTAGEAPYPVAPYPPADSGEYNPGNGPAPSPLPLNGTLPPYFASLPPGAAILPPPDNLTDTYDEDDPSIYYPPPYSFFYPKDNSTDVPPGPLVPGIILPPPPNFFAPLESDKKESKPNKTITRSRKPSTTSEPPQLHPTTTPIPPTSVIQNVQSKVITYIPKTTKKEKLIPTTPEVVTILPVRQKTTTDQSKTNAQNILKKKKPLSVTILKPVKHTFTPAPPNNYYDENEVSHQPFKIYGPPNGGRIIINTTQIPLKAFYSTSNEIDSNSVTDNPKRPIYKTASAKLVAKTTSIPAAQYYFYEEGAQINDVTTKRPMRPSLPDPYISAQSTQNPNIPEQIYYVTSKPRNTPRPRYRYLQQTSKPDTFRIHIARLKQQLQSYVTPRPYQENTYNQRIPKPVYQYSFQAANYPQQPQQYVPNAQTINEDNFKPLPKYSVQIQPAIEILPSQQIPYQNTPASPVYYPQKYQQTSERPQYIQANNQDYDYQETGSRQKYSAPVRQYLPQNQQNIPQKQQPYIVTPQSVIAPYGYEATPNPIYNNYYTKPDEKYFDDITKKYFTIFGKKLPAGTTPIPPTAQQRPIYTNADVANQQYIKKPISLARDTLVNYLQPRPEENRDAEYISIPNQPQKSNAQSETYVQPQETNKNQQSNVDIVKALPFKNQDEKSGSYISYQLPGDDGAHFYFLTPQLVKRTDQGSGFYFSQLNNPRKRRNEEEE